MTALQRPHDDAITGEQAALRRVATLVARAAPPEKVFAAVTEEAGRLLDAHQATMSRYVPDGTIVVAAWGKAGAAFPVGSRWSLGGRNPPTLVFQTCQPARTDDYADVSDLITQAARQHGLLSLVGVPVSVEGRLWGVMLVGSTREEPLLPGTEARLAGFTELAATAIANAQARVELGGFADEQAALRRVATLVARAALPEEVFAAVTEEAGRRLGVNYSVMARYDPDGTRTIVAAWSSTGPTFRVGSLMTLGGLDVPTMVFQTGRAARINDYDGDDASGPIAEAVSAFGLRAAVGVPVSVEGRLWGVMIVGSRAEPLPAGAEARLAGFTELAATAIASAQARVELRGFADEQAALRRVATLVARAAPPGEVFAAVTEEAGRLLHADYATMNTYGPDGTSRVVAGWDSTGAVFPVGTQAMLGGQNVSTLVFQTGRAARIDDYAGASGPVADTAREFGFGAAVGVPVGVESRMWGVMVVASREEPLPAGTEARLAGFTELAATAIANAQARVELRGFADEQAALRRVATLVARAAAPEEVFATVTEEAGRVLGADYITMARYDPDGAATVVASWSSAGAVFPIGSRWSLGGRNLNALVFQTGRAGRIDDYADASGPAGEAVREFGFRAAVGVPVCVEGGIWGVMLVASREEPLPAGAEARLAGFTELAATAIANAQARVEVRGFADEQAALRKVATLVAGASPPSQVLAAVIEEAGRLLHTDYATMARYGPDGTITVVAFWSSAGAASPVGSRERLGGRNVPTLVFQTGRPARIDDYARGSGPIAEAACEFGIGAAVGVPVSVEGRLWGVMVVGSRAEP